MKKPNNIKICLNAMVGAEANTISRMLESVADYIDYYVIQCNGADNTKEIINTFFQERGIPGFTYEINWNFPGWNRDHTLQECLKSEHGCDWILRMDADEQLSVDDSFDWSVFENKNIDAFNITADAGDTMYYRTWLWNADRPWFFAHDKRHETIHLPEVGEEFQRVNLSTEFKHIITNDGMTWFAPMKFLTDALELERDKVPTNKVLEDDYHLWYIGKSYSDCLGDVDNFPYGKHHQIEFARRSIFYFEMFLDQQHQYLSTQKPKSIDDMGYFACLLIGDAYGIFGNHDAKIEWWNRATDFNPRRNENYLRIWNATRDEAAKSKLLDVNRTNPFPEYSFLILNAAYWDTNPNLKAMLDEETKSEDISTPTPKRFSASGIL